MLSKKLFATSFVVSLISPGNLSPCLVWRLSTAALKRSDLTRMLIWHLFYFPTHSTRGEAIYNSSAGSLASRLYLSHESETYVASSDGIAISQLNGLTIA
jgi:hypothetical protein